MMYELIDVQTGNLVGAYPTQQEAVRAVIDTIASCGEEAVETLALGKFESPADPGRMIASGKDLVALARANSEISSRMTTYEMV